MVLFCPTCGNMLLVEQAASVGLRFFCQVRAPILSLGLWSLLHLSAVRPKLSETFESIIYSNTFSPLLLLFCFRCKQLQACPYTHRVYNEASETVALTKKRAEFILGSADDWKNVQETDSALCCAAFLTILPHMPFPLVSRLIHCLSPVPPPTPTSVVCAECGHNRAYYKSMQIRSADEPSSIWYRCSNHSCGYQWRED